MNSNLLSFKTISHQKGMVLLVSLILVALMSIVAVTAIKGSNLQEAMSGNMLDRNISFQSAETAIESAEKVLNGTTGSLNTDGTDAQYADLQQPGKTPPYLWTATEWSANAKEVSVSWKNFSAKPRYAIELITVVEDAAYNGGAADFDGTMNNVEKEFYRVTGRDMGMTGNSEVILQTTYIR